MSHRFSHLRLLRRDHVQSPISGNSRKGAQKVLAQALADYWPDYRGNRELASALYQLGFIDGETYMRHCHRHNVYPLEYETGPNVHQFGSKSIPDGHFKPRANGFSSEQMDAILARYGEEWVRKIRTLVTDFLPNHIIEKQPDGTFSIVFQCDVTPDVIEGFSDAGQAEIWLENIQFYNDKSEPLHSDATTF